MIQSPEVTETPQRADAVADSGYGRVFADFYDRLFPRDAGAEQTARTLAEWHPGGRALELGVGTGRIALPLARRTGEVVGVDSSPEMLERLRAAIGEAAPPTPPVSPVHGDIRCWADGTAYGLVYCVCATLSMLLDPAEQRAAIATAVRHLAPGGTLVVETHNPAFVRALHEGRTHATWFAPYPEPGTGLQTYSTLVGGDVWHASHLWHEGGTVRVGSELSRLTTPDEVDAYAVAAGLVPVSRHGDWAGTAFTDGSPLQINRYTFPSEDGDHGQD